MEKAAGTITLRWELAQPPAAVWAAWTEPAVMIRWFGSDPLGRGLNARADVRVGGSFEVHFQNGSGSEHICFGTYQEVAVSERLVFTWGWRESAGRPERVSVRFSSSASGTIMEFEHRDISNADHDYSVGWRTTFQKLERVLGGATAAVLRTTEPLRGLDHLLSPLFYENPRALLGTELNAVFLFEMKRELGNGGFDQFFFNTTGQYLKETLAALDAVKDNTVAALLKRGAAVFPNGNVPRGFAARHRAMEKVESEAAPLWEELTAMYRDAENELDILLLAYVETHLGGFR